MLSQHELGDEGDVAQETCDGEVSSKLVQSESRELAQIERAIARLKEGKYGICEGCDGRISRDRLLAVPYAMLCIKCQRAIEEPSGFPLRRAAGESWESKRIDRFDRNPPKVPMRKRRSAKVSV